MVVQRPADVLVFESMFERCLLHGLIGHKQRYRHMDTNTTDIIEKCILFELTKHVESELHQSLCNSLSTCVHLLWHTCYWPLFRTAESFDVYLNWLLLATLIVTFNRDYLEILYQLIHVWFRFLFCFTEDAASNSEMFIEKLLFRSR